MTSTTTSPRWATFWTIKALADLPADLTTATPAQVDEVLRTVQLDAAAIDGRIERAVVVVRRAIGQRPTQAYEGTGRNRRLVTTWPTSAVDAVETARDLDPATPDYNFGDSTVGAALDTLNGLLGDLAAARTIEDRMDAEFTRRGGWTRYFRVDNTGGHVHTETSCRTTYRDTAWSWPTQLSGATDTEVVDAAGSLTCLVCFPNEREDILAQRPVRFDMFETVEQRATRIEREETAAARKAKKIANGVTADGSPLVVQEPRFRGDSSSPRELKTARAAELCYVEFAAKAQLSRTTAFETGVYRTSAAQILGALAAKRGTTVEALTEAFAKKVEKKRIAEDW